MCAELERERKMERKGPENWMSGSGAGTGLEKNTVEQGAGRSRSCERGLQKEA